MSNAKWTMIIEKRTIDDEQEKIEQLTIGNEQENIEQWTIKQWTIKQWTINIEQLTLNN